MKFVVSAPAKVILFGEHAVVYGYPAISSAIGLRCYFEVITEPSYTNSDFITIQFQDLDHTTISLPRSLCSTNSSQLIPNQLTDYSWSVVSNILNKPIDLAAKQNALNRSLCVLVYLIFRIITMKPDLPSPNSSSCIENLQTSIRLTIHSDIPESSGLGSSAAYSVSASTVLLYLFGYLSIGPDWIPNLEQSGWIKQLGREAETIIHGKSSGLDTTTSTQGGLLVYRNSDQPYVKPLILNQTDMSKLNILLVDSRITRSTHQVIEKLADAYETNPNVGDLFEQIGNLVQTAINSFSQSNLDLDKIGVLIRRNQELLQQLQVSCSQLDDLIDYLGKFRIPAKLTGAGCGGFLIGFPLSGDLGSSTLLEQPDQMTKILDYLRHEKQLWAKIVQISDRGVRFKLCSL